VIDIAVALWDGDILALDETYFWRELFSDSDSLILSPIAIIIFI
jgi:hypothetical protein